jgi:hypothetical protein
MYLGKEKGPGNIAVPEVVEMTCPAPWFCSSIDGVKKRGLSWLRIEQEREKSKTQLSIPKVKLLKVFILVTPNLQHNYRNP